MVMFDGAGRAGVPGRVEREEKGEKRKKRKREDRKKEWKKTNTCRRRIVPKVFLMVPTSFKAIAMCIGLSLGFELRLR